MSLYLTALDIRFCVSYVYVIRSAVCIERNKPSPLLRPLASVCAVVLVEYLFLYQFPVHWGKKKKKKTLFLFINALSVKQIRTENVCRMPYLTALDILLHVS